MPEYVTFCLSYPCQLLMVPDNRIPIASLSSPFSQLSLSNPEGIVLQESEDGDENANFGSIEEKLSCHIR